jgi:two-component system sensor histidine kinase UhpB
VFLANALVLALATAALILSPATVSFPVALTEAIVLTVGLSVMLALNLLLLRRAFSPLEQLRAFMRGADPLRPGVRAPQADATPELRAVTEGFNEMIARLESERRDSAARALAAQEEERLRIARELHDEVGQKLTAVMLQLEALSGRHQASLIEEPREGVRDALEEVRSIARRLRPEALDHLGLVSALTALTNSLTGPTGLVIERRIDRSVEPLDADVELVLYRVAQEALTNVARHAQCRCARLTLRRLAPGVELEVADGGRGFDSDHVREGAGIRGMRERAVLIGGQLNVSSTPRRGTTVTLRWTPGGRS